MEKNKRMSVKNEFYYYIVLYYIILMKHNIFLEEIDIKETEYYISVKEFLNEVPDANFRILDMAR